MHLTSLLLCELVFLIHCQNIVKSNLGEVSYQSTRPIQAEFIPVSVA